GLYTTDEMQQAENDAPAPAPVAPARDVPRLSPEKAAGLAEKLQAAGIVDAQAFASDVVGRAVGALTDLTTGEALRVFEALPQEDVTDAEFKPVAPPTKTPHLGGEKLDDGLTAQEFEDLVALEPNPWEAEQENVFDPPKGEPAITAAQLKALHTRLTKLGFNGKASEKERARDRKGVV